LAPGDAGLFVRANLHPIDDRRPKRSNGWPMTPMSRRTSSRRRDDPFVSDPASSIALNEEEIGWLGGFLASKRQTAEVMSLEQIDGYYCALMMDPDRVRAARMGGRNLRAGDQTFIFRQPRAGHARHPLARARLEHCRRSPRCGVPALPAAAAVGRAQGPALGQGFIQGMQVAGAEWSHYINDEEEVCAFLVPILMLSLNDHEEYKGVRNDAGMRVKCAALLPNAISRLHAAVQVSELKRPARHPRPRPKHQDRPQ